MSRREELAYRLWLIAAHGLCDEHVSMRESFKAYWDTDFFVREVWSRHADSVLETIAVSEDE